LEIELIRFLKYLEAMKPLGKILACLFLLGSVACRKNAERVDGEVQEAGYTMTQEGWLKAIRADHLEVVKKMAKTGFNIKARDENGQHSLHVAAEAGSIDVAEYLLNAKVGINDPDHEGRTPLMLAVLSGRSVMVRWLLKQGADPKLKDNKGYMALMLAVSQHQVKPLEELAPYHREDLDSALLLAAYEGDAAAIDTLTNYGASVHARMSDGRTPLMLAAQNGHQEAVAILMDVGASRHATTESGETAQSLAIAKGHKDIAEMIEKGFSSDTIALDSDDQIAMTLAVEKKNIPVGSGSSDKVVMLEGAKISNFSDNSKATASTKQNSPIIMRQYSQRELPVEVKKVYGDTATLRLGGKSAREISVRAGDPIPNSKLVVVKVSTRTEIGKLNNSQPIYIGVVQVEDKETGRKMDWRSGSPAVGHDPVALVEDAVTGRRYLAKNGQKFTSEDGREFIVSDVRPGQLIIEDVTSGEVSTLLLRGPRG
jgi:ankyrin repeat protein